MLNIVNGYLLAGTALTAVHYAKNGKGITKACKNTLKKEGRNLSKGGKAVVIGIGIVGGTATNVVTKPCQFAYGGMKYILRDREY